MVDFPSYFAGIENKLRADLDLIRATTTHAGNKGSKAEVAFRAFLNDHLPRSLEVGHGEAIDQNGNNVVSRRGGDHQIDVLVISDAHPRFGNINDPNTYFIEGVLAGGEVKSSLTLGMMDDIFKQAVAFKKLKANLDTQIFQSTNETDRSRFYHRRPYFLFAFESKVKVEPLMKRIFRLQEEHRVGPTDHIDAIFLLGQGAIYSLGDGTSSFQMRRFDGNPVKGWGHNKKTETLMPLIGWLSGVMPVISNMTSIATPYLVEVF